LEFLQVGFGPASLLAARQPDEKCDDDRYRSGDGHHKRSGEDQGGGAVERSDGDAELDSQDGWLSIAASERALECGVGRGVNPAGWLGPGFHFPQSAVAIIDAAIFPDIVPIQKTASISIPLSSSRNRFVK
jgi:hypothetical protein